MESSSTIPLTVVLSILTSFLFQHIRLLTKLKNGTYLANIEKEYRVRASATYDMGLDTYGTITSQRVAVHFMRFKFGCSALMRLTVSPISCLSASRESSSLIRTFFILLYIINNLFPCPVLGGIGLQMVNKEHHALPPFSLKVMLTVPPLT